MSAINTLLCDREKIGVEFNKYLNNLLEQAVCQLNIVGGKSNCRPTNLNGVELDNLQILFENEHEQNLIYFDNHMFVFERRQTFFVYSVEKKVTIETDLVF